MSTRAVVNFCDGSAEHIRAKVYRHGDGYPEGLGKDLRDFLALVKKTVLDTRFDDASYLAAKWVVHDAERMANTYDAEKKEYVPNKNRLNFLSVGIVMEDPGDIDYIYDVVCTGYELPKITHRKPR